MARYRGPVEKLERRFGVSLALKGERRLAGKSALDKRPYAPGQHGARKGKISEYGLQLREKQKAKFMYGVSEKQFRRLFAEAARREGNTGVLLIQLLEQRLDNVVYRMGFATTRRFARQLVTHGHVLVNGKRVDIPSFRVEAGAKIEIIEKAKTILKLQELSNLQHKLESLLGLMLKKIRDLEFSQENLKEKKLSFRLRKDLSLSFTLNNRG